MLKKILLSLLTVFMASSNHAIAEEPDPLIIYVAISEVKMPNGIGTSEQLNSLVLHHGSSTGTLRGQLLKGYPPKFDPDRSIDVYDRSNIKFVYDNCDYINTPLECGVKNNHWTIRTFVTVGDKYSTIVVKLYDEKGRQISKGTKTAWGTIRYVPQWKLTVITEKGGLMGDKSTEIYEEYPPKIEELPPLMAPYHVWQSMILMQASVKLK